VLVAGGTDNSGACLASAELYDPATGTWTTTDSLDTARGNHTATLLLNGQVLVAGGCFHLASAELYDPASETWTATGNMNRGRDGHTATLLSNGQVLAVGGSRGNFHFAIKTELYDPPSGTWILTHPLLNSNNRKYHTATLLPDGLVLVAGGDRGGPLSTAGLYDPATGMWAATASMGSARAAHTATLLPSGQMLVAGGLGNGLVAVSSAELYE
jgi:hypothetical protein